jgi:hypothetical protein
MAEIDRWAAAARRGRAGPRLHPRRYAASRAQRGARCAGARAPSVPPLIRAPRSPCAQSPDPTPSPASPPPTPSLPQGQGDVGQGPRPRPGRLQRPPRRRAGGRRGHGGRHRARRAACQGAGRRVCRRRDGQPAGRVGGDRHGARDAQPRRGRGAAQDGGRRRRALRRLHRDGARPRRQPVEPVPEARPAGARRRGSGGHQDPSAQGRAQPQGQTPAQGQGGRRRAAAGAVAGGGHRQRRGTRARLSHRVPGRLHLQRESRGEGGLEGSPW